MAEKQFVPAVRRARRILLFGGTFCCQSRDHLSQTNILPGLAVVGSFVDGALPNGGSKVQRL